MNSATEVERLKDMLREVCSLDSASPVILWGRAHHVHTNSRFFESKRGCTADLILYDPESPAQQKHAEIKVAAGHKGSWLTIDLCPTTFIAGNNIHPATFRNLATGNAYDTASSAPASMQPMFRLPFNLLEQIHAQLPAESEELFDPLTKAAIGTGDIHIIRAQWAACLQTDVARFIQTIPTICGHVIAQGKTVIDIAHHLKVKFDFLETTNGRVPGVLFRKKHGKKPLFSVSMYDKDIQIHRMKQGRSITPEEKATAKSAVRVDMTAHSLGIEAIARAAQAKLKALPEGNETLDGLRQGKFSEVEPASTIWWLERAVFVLSHWMIDDTVKRSTFARWLVPYLLRDILRLDVVTGFTRQNFQRIFELDDPIAKAWIAYDGRGGWVQAILKQVKASEATVRNRQAKWREEYGIDIALPFALYRDLLQLGPRSFLSNRERTALLKAENAKDVEAQERIIAKAEKVFDERRIGMVGRAVTGPRYGMPTRIATMSPTTQPKLNSNREPSATILSPVEPLQSGVGARADEPRKTLRPRELFGKKTGPRLVRRH
jgi:hypothetical protein